MSRLVRIAQQWVSQTIRPGDIAVDATLGNGHDTFFLSECVGRTGHVWGFDVQPVAICQACRRLATAGYTNFTPLPFDHTAADRHLPWEIRGQVAAVMFNLGYLPGHDSGIATDAASSHSAIASLLKFLRKDGILTAIAYTGHEGGWREAESIATVFAGLPPSDYRTETIVPENTNAPPPRLYAAWRR